MGTRGLIGFVVDGVQKLGYSHWGSCPEDNGIVMLEFARGMMSEGDRYGRASVNPNMLKLIRDLEVVKRDDKPTKEQQERLARYADTNVSGGELDEWYVLLRDTQGDPRAILECGFIIDNASFAADSLFNEGSYLIDLDTNVYEAYLGFVKEPHTDGRFADMEPAPNPNGVVEYYPIRLGGSWPLTDLPRNEDFLAHMAIYEDDD